MEVTWTSKARKGLKKIPARDRAKLVMRVENYAETGEGDVKPMAGSPGEYRIRSGNYRAIFEIRDNMIIVRAGHRRDIYR